MSKTANIELNNLALRKSKSEPLSFLARADVSYVSAIISFGFLAAGYLIGNSLFSALGCILYFSLILVSNQENSMKLLLVFAPSMAIISLSRDGIGLYGFGYFLVLLKQIFTKKIRLYPIPLLSSALLLLIGFSRIIENANYYDFAILCEVACSVFVWISYFKSIEKNAYLPLYNAFLFGCILLFANIIISVVFGDCKINRWAPLNDDPNYTGCTLCVLLMCTLIVFAYKLPSKGNFLIMALCSFFGLMTGSRGFLLSAAVGVLVFLVASLFGRKEKKVALLFIAGLLVLVLMYFLRIDFAVNIYETTIGRTLALSNNYSTSAYMDFTSGRIFLWNYYWSVAINDGNLMLFGRGFYNYHLVENGGYGQVAHNAYISSIIGLGLIGTIALILLYVSMIKKEFSLDGKREHWVFLSIPIVIAVDLVFLDGILDSRLVVFFATFISLFHVYINQSKNGRNLSSHWV